MRNNIQVNNNGKYKVAQNNSNIQQNIKKFRWTNDGRPICAFCGIVVGHIYRECRRRCNFSQNRNAPSQKRITQYSRYFGNNNRLIKLKAPVKLATASGCDRSQFFGSPYIHNIHFGNKPITFKSLIDSRADASCISFNTFQKIPLKSVINYHLQIVC